jgi:hypothetical protein
MCIKLISETTQRIPVIQPEHFLQFRQSYQTNAGIVPRTRDDCAFPNPFQFIINLSSIHSALRSLVTENFIK